VRILEIVLFTIMPRLRLVKVGRQGRAPASEALSDWAEIARSAMATTTAAIAANR
jgi:hypothetical protein